MGLLIYVVIWSCWGCVTHAAARKTTTHTYTHPLIETHVYTFIIYIRVHIYTPPHTPTTLQNTYYKQGRERRGLFAPCARGADSGGDGTRRPAPPDGAGPGGRAAAQADDQLRRGGGLYCVECICVYVRGLRALCSFSGWNAKTLTHSSYPSQTVPYGPLSHAEALVALHTVDPEQAKIPLKK